MSDSATFPVTVQVQRRDEMYEHREVDDRDGEATSKLVRDQEGSDDVTLVVQIPTRDDRMLIAISGDRAFVGLEGPSGIFQFRHRETAGREPALMLVGGQTTQIDGSYVWSVQGVAEIARTWITGEGHAPGEWERQ